MDNNFGDRLNNLKILRGWSSAELARKARITPGLLSGLIHGQRVIGEYTAKKLGKALQLSGVELDEFIYDAINHCAQKTLESSKGYPAELINLVTGKLRESGIAPSDIAQCVWRGKNTDASLRLNNGTEARLKLELVFA